MRQHPFLRFARFGGALVLSGLLTCAHAVELGDVLVRSHLGQPLVADIELTGIVNDAATVQAGLADADVYRGANITVHPAVAALNISVTRRDGKRFLHLTSPKSVASDFVHVFFELNENGRRSVRQATLWFTPDPNPAPPSPPKPAPAPAAAPVVVAVAVAPAPVAAPVKVSAVAPPPRIAAAPVIAPVVVAAAPLLRAAPVARPAACVPQFTAAQIGTCAALDAKNAALSAQIVELEEKVRRLTVAMHAGMAPAAVVAPVRPLVKPLPDKLVPMGAPVGKPAGATPWLFIGVVSAVVLALVGTLLYLLRRQRRAGTTRVAAAARPSLIASLRQRLMPGKTKVAAIARPSFIASVRKRLMPGKKDGGAAEKAERTPG